MLCAGLLTAQFVAAKAARDAIYLDRLDVTTLPQIVIATAICSIGLVALSSWGLRRLSPAAVVPIAFAVSGVLFVIEWAFAAIAPATIARVLYLHVSGLGPMLASGFWLIAAERFDPHTAKKHFAKITAAGTFGGLVGALIAERVTALLGIFAILLVLAALNAICAWQIRQLARPLDEPGRRRVIEASPELSAEPARLGVRALAATPYLRHLAALVFLGTMGAALLDYVFKAEAVAALGNGERLLRFFAAYYAATSVVTFIVQTSASRLVLERFGLATAAATPSLALLLGGAGVLLVPGWPATIAARGAESIVRGSLFRSGYELFYTPVPSTERRAAKSIIDVGFDRLGDAAGGALIRLLQPFAVAQPHAALVAAAMGCAGLALAAAGRLRRGYVQTLERSLMARAVELDLSEVTDVTTRTTIFRALGQRPSPRGVSAALEPLADAPPLDRDVQRIIELGSRDRTRILTVLAGDEGITAGLTPHVVRLLAWDAVADEAVHALRTVAEERVGELTDALLDPNQPFAVRRRLPRVFSVCVSQRAADGLMWALDDIRFEVRFQCGRSLAAIVDRNPRVRIDAARVLEAAHREVGVSRPVWESRRLLDRFGGDAERSLVDDFVDIRANDSLAHVFTLLTLAFPGEPLRIAFRGLHTDDARLRGTALEYLEHVLPSGLRERLWPWLEGAPAPARSGRSRETVLADLLQSNPSIMMNLEELRRMHHSTTLESR
jgi:AAA family ATP:ADP antiporter